MAKVICVKDSDNSHGIALVFVHGLSGDSHTTWMYNPADVNSFWPKWLANDTQCATWTVSYDAALSNWVDSAMPLPDQGTSVLDCLASEPRLQNRQLVLIGHSMGGLVIKTAIVQANTLGTKRYAELINRVSGVIFIATPHNGSHLANLAKALTPILRTNEQVGDLSIHNPYLKQLHQQFLAFQQVMGFYVRTFAESKKVKKVLFGKDWRWNPFCVRIMVVDRSSAEPHVPGETAISLTEDHFSICKPREKSYQLYISIVSFVSERRLIGSAQPNVEVIPGDDLSESDGRAADHRGKNGEEYWDVFANVHSYLDAGDFASAINCQLGGKEFLDCDPETCIDIVAICQKFGLLDKAENYIAQLSKLDNKSRWQSHHEACLEVIRFKVLSQRHRHDEVIKEYNKLCATLRNVGRRDLVSGVLRRAAVAFAVHGDCIMAKGCLEKAGEVSKEANNPHDNSTSDVYTAMIGALACQTGSPSTYVEYLIKAQEIYLNVSPDRIRFQAMPLKSAIQSLYAEAAVLLTHNRTHSAGMIRIAIAHLLGPQGHTNPDEEGYAELLALIQIQHKRNSAMFQQAMRSDDESRMQFQEKWPECSHYIQQCKLVPGIFQKKNSDAWRELRTFIQKLDRIFEGAQEIL